MNEPRPYYHQRSLFGPLFLAAVGVLFLLRNMGIISYGTMGWWFSRYWPVLLIIWGVIKLLEFLWARRDGRPAPGIGAGGVVFLIFLIMFGIASTKASGVNWAGVSDNFDFGVDDDHFGIFGTQYEFTENISQPVPVGAPVKVLGARGNISITASADNQAHAFLHKYLRTNSQNEANQLNDSTHAKFEQQGDTLVLELVSGNFERGRYDVDLQVPRNSSVSVNTRRGDIHLSQRDKDVDLDSMRGDIFVEEVKGNVATRLRRGDVTIKTVSGNVSVDGTVGDSNVSDIGGTLTFSGSYTGDIQLSHIAKQVRFSSLRTDLQFAKLEGELHMDRGDFRGNAISGPFRLDTQARDIDIKEVSGDIHIQDTRGSVEVHTALPLGVVDIANKAGEINVSLPEKAGFQVDAESDNGDIMSDFQIAVNNTSRNATATGTVGKGGPQVRLKTNRGTIQIHKEEAR